MKFFDPKKKDSNGTVGPSSAYNPVTTPTPGSASEKGEQHRPASSSARTSQTTLGAGIIVKGDIKSDENMTIDGVLEGSVHSTRDVFIGSQGKVRADIWAANVIISGMVVGNITAMNKVDLTSSGQLQGNIRAAKLSIAESALFKGSIDMSSPDGASSSSAEKEVRATASPAVS